MNVTVPSSGELIKRYKEAKDVKEVMERVTVPSSGELIKRAGPGSRTDTGLKIRFAVQFVS